MFGGEPGERLGDRRASVDGLVHGRGKEPGGEVVLSGWETHRQLTVDATVHLGRSSSAGSAASGQPAVFGRQQSVGDKPVEVKGGNGAGHPHRRGCVILADGSVPG